MSPNSNTQSVSQVMPRNLQALSLRGPIQALSLILILSLWGCSAGMSPAGTESPPIADSSPELDSLLQQAKSSFAESFVFEDNSAEIAAALEAALTAQLQAKASHKATQSFYQERAYAPLFLSDSQWGPQAEVARQILLQAPDHALSGEYPDPETISAMVDAFQSSAAQHQSLHTFTPTAADWERVRETLRVDGSFDPKSPAALEALFLRLHSSSGDNPMPRLATQIQDAKEHQNPHLEKLTDLETTFAASLSEYASEMRLGYADNTPRRAFFGTQVQPDTFEQARVGAFLLDFSEEPNAALDALMPIPSQYKRLVDARRRYVTIAANGGWPTLKLSSKDERSLQRRRKKNLPIIQEIKHRLSLEGYDAGELNEHHNTILIDAIKSYQDTHQMRRNGEIKQSLIKNLNLSVENRLAKIDVTLQRYRESRLGSYDYYIFVNIPDFHAEVWRAGVREMRFRIVVGNNKLLRIPGTKTLIKDRKGAAQFANRTPMQIAFLKYVIYNPYWNVPPRIRREELDLHLEENPYWYEDNNYEVMHPDNPRRSYVRQLPGPGNALGKVKFIFPNPHNVFLHDTASRSLFKLPVRAFSHGCMRVHEPLKFAEYLLKTDNQYNKKRVRKILRTKPLKETTLRLRRAIPVHIDYFNTRVNDDGHVTFLSDIYRYDRENIAARIKGFEAL